MKLTTYLPDAMFGKLLTRAARSQVADRIKGKPLIDRRKGGNRAVGSVVAAKADHALRRILVTVEVTAGDCDLGEVMKGLSVSTRGSHRRPGEAREELEEEWSELW